MTWVTLALALPLDVDVVNNVFIDLLNQDYDQYKSCIHLNMLCDFVV